MSAASALLYLRATSLRNAVAARVARLKQPKYLAGAVVGVAYFVWVFGRPFGRPARQIGVDGGLPLDSIPTVISIAAVLVMLFVAFNWSWPRSRAALTFSEAEIAFLFTAPISRRTLIHFRWLNTQLRILFTSLILTLVSSAWSFVPGNAAVRLVGWWLLLSTLDLHAVGSSFALTRLLDRGLTSRRRRVLTVSIVLAVAGAALLAARNTLPPPEPGILTSPAAIYAYVGSLLATEPLTWLLEPARRLVQPLLAHDLAAFAAALGPALVIYAAHYWWVLRSEVSFEEASLAKAEKRAARLGAMLREGTVRFGGERKARPAPFALAPTGRPEVAFLWKNLLASASYLQRPRAAVVVLVVIVSGSLALRGVGIPPLSFLVAMLAAFGAAYTLVFGPMVARQDLRHDLPNADILKTYPLAGRQIVLGEVLAPVAIVTMLVWLQLLTAALNIPRLPRGGPEPVLGAAVALGAAVVAPFVCTTLVLLMNAVVLLFPAWAPQATAARGIDVLGQRILFVGVLFLSMAAVVLPAGVAAATVFLLAAWLLGAAAAAVLALLGALVCLGVEIAVAISWLGKRFERFDLSAEQRP